MDDYCVIDQMPAADGGPVIYGEGLTLVEARLLKQQIEEANDGRVPLVYDYLPARTPSSTWRIVSARHSA